MKLPGFLKAPKDSAAEPRRYNYPKEHHGVPSNIALIIIDDNFSADEIKSVSICSPSQLKEYCKILYQASQISQERCLAITDGLENLPSNPSGPKTENLS